MITAGNDDSTFITFTELGLRLKLEQPALRKFLTEKGINVYELITGVDRDRTFAVRRRDLEKHQIEIQETKREKFL